MDIKSTNITAVAHRVPLEDRWRSNGHRGGVMWFTGLSGSGKTTLSLELEHRLFRSGCQVYVLDGDNVRHGLSADLGFSPGDRSENIRRIGEVAALFANAGLIVLTAFISPYRADRLLARRAADMAGADFCEVHVDASLAVCEARDPKGLYRKARAGKIPDFTGISAPYEAPNDPDLVIDTDGAGVQDCVERLAQFVERRFTIPSDCATGS